MRGMWFQKGWQEDRRPKRFASTRMKMRYRPGEYVWAMVELLDNPDEDPWKRMLIIRLDGQGYTLIFGDHELYYSQIEVRSDDEHAARTLIL